MKTCPKTPNLVKIGQKTSGYFYRRHKSATKALVCNTQHFSIADSDMQLNIHRLRIVEFPFQQRSCERATMLRYTNIAYLVFSRVYWLFCVKKISEIRLQGLRKTTKKTSGQLVYRVKIRTRHLHNTRLQRYR